jgi:hypothetical protein
MLRFILSTTRIARNTRAGRTMPPGPTTVPDYATIDGTVKDWYTTEEFAQIVGKAEFTCREWCRHGRIHAAKRKSGRGKSCSWATSHEELLRYQREGLLPENGDDRRLLR